VSDWAAPIRAWTRHRELVLGLTRRELTSPFAGSAFGVAWALLHPLLQMGIYLVVFTSVFEVRFGGAMEGLDYPTYILSGMASWLGWAALLSAACTTVVGSASLVKQADFPAQILPLRTVLTTLVPHAISLTVLVVFALVRRSSLPWTAALLPVAVGLHAVAMLGAASLLGALCVFVRDVKEVVTVFTAMGIFLTPAFYTPEMIAGAPGAFGTVLALNPFTHFLQIYRDCLFWGEVHPVSWAVSAGLALILTVVGTRAFARLRIFFGNFL